jgi:hypothetical protein
MLSQLLSVVSQLLLRSQILNPAPGFTAVSDPALPLPMPNA